MRDPIVADDVVLDDNFDVTFGIWEVVACPICLGLNIPPPYAGSLDWVPICNDARSSNKLLSMLVSVVVGGPEVIGIALADNGIEVDGWEEIGRIGDSAMNKTV